MEQDEHKTKIGKRLIKMLMFNLYSDNRVIYREYVQNASDSIHKAIEQGIIEPKDGHISITIENTQITIHDNGIGISVNEVQQTLKDIANSNKGDEQAGYFGIGRLSGGGYCKKLKFKTSFKGEKIASEIIFDVQAIDKIINDNNDNSSAEEIIDKCTKFYKYAEKEEYHYFNVFLEDVKPEYSIILDENAIVNYLKEVAPIQFTPSFKKNILDVYKDNNDNNDKDSIISYYDKLSTIRVSVNNNNDIRKPYSTKIIGTNEPIENIRFFLLKNNEFGDLAWGWIAITTFSIQIPENVDGNPNPTNGIRLRLHNIGIGTKNFFDGTTFFKEARGNKYFNGEIHVINKNIKPTPQRDDLAPSLEKKALDEEIRLLFQKEFEQIYKHASNLKNDLTKFNERKIDINTLHDNFIKKTNNQYKNYLGYQYMLNVYRPKYQELFDKFYNKPKEELPSEKNINSIPNNNSENNQNSINVAKEPDDSNNNNSNSNQSNNNSEQGNGINNHDNSVQENETVKQEKSNNENEPDNSSKQDNQSTGNQQYSNNQLDQEFVNLYNTIGIDKTDLVRDIFNLIDKNFSDKKKVPVYKIAKTIKLTILKELGKKKK